MPVRRMSPTIDAEVAYSTRQLELTSFVTVRRRTILPASTSGAAHTTVFWFGREPVSDRNADLTESTGLP